jgi:HAE1 family hydrophobic/amphiphilic exporter-1
VARPAAARGAADHAATSTNALREQNVQVAAGERRPGAGARGQLYQLCVRVEDGCPRRGVRQHHRQGRRGRIARPAARTSARASWRRDLSSLLRFQGVTPSASASSSCPPRTRSTSRAREAELTRLSKQLPPGLKYRSRFDTTTSCSDSIREVLKTLVEAIVLVVLVIFIFLQTWRSTLIPAITIPVSLIGAFAFIKLMDFSINTLTLFGIILATGIVVDDAIVVIENIERHIQEFRCRRGRPRRTRWAKCSAR